MKYLNSTKSFILKIIKHFLCYKVGKRSFSDNGKFDFPLQIQFDSFQPIGLFFLEVENRVQKKKYL